MNRIPWFSLEYEAALIAHCRATACVLVFVEEEREARANIRGEYSSSLSSSLALEDKDKMRNQGAQVEECDKKGASRASRERKTSEAFLYEYYRDQKKPLDDCAGSNFPSSSTPLRKTRTGQIVLSTTYVADFLDLFLDEMITKEDPKPHFREGLLDAALIGRPGTYLSSPS